MKILLKNFNIIDAAIDEHSPWSNGSVEGMIGKIKSQAEYLLYAMGVDPSEWIHAVQYVVEIHNHMVTERLGETPLCLLTGETTDMSKFAHMAFGSVVQYMDESTKEFPKWRMRKAIYLGPSPSHIGGPMSLKLRTLTKDSNGKLQYGRVIHRQIVRVLATPKLQPFQPSPSKEGESTEPPKIDLEEIDRDGTGIEEIIDREDESLSDDERRTLSEDAINRDPSEIPQIPMIDTYDDGVEHGKKYGESTWVVQEIVNHRISPDGKLELEVTWEGARETTHEPFRRLATDVPILVANYILEKRVRMESKEGIKEACAWAKKSLQERKRVSIGLSTTRAKKKRIEKQCTEASKDLHPAAKREIEKAIKWAHGGEKGYERVVRAIKPMPSSKYGVPLPTNIAAARREDEALDADPDLSNSVGGNRWRKAIAKETSKILERECFEVADGDENALRRLGYQAVRCFFIFDVKADGTFKARFVAGGNSIDSSDHLSYMSVIDSNHAKLLFTIAQANGQEVLCADIANAYLSAQTKEKCYCRLGPEWGEDMSGKLVIFKKALYGLASSGHQFHRYVFDRMTEMGWTHCEVDHDIWYRRDEKNNLYSYCAYHSDDILIVAKNPSEVAEELRTKFELKSLENPSRYLGADIKLVNGKYVFGTSTYIKEILDQCGAEFGKTAFRKWKAPLDQALDLTDDEATMGALLTHKGRRLYMRYVGILTWLVTLGRFEIKVAASLLARFQTEPREKHLEAAERVFGYLRYNTNFEIRIDHQRVKLPPGSVGLDKSIQADIKHNYEYAVEQRSSRDPTPRGVEIPTTIFVDSDWGAAQNGRRSVTGALICAGSTPIRCISKRQSSVETSTYAAEFAAARTAVEAAIGLRLLLRSMGVPVTEPTAILVDNLAVVQSSTRFASPLKKKHVSIAYHRCRESVAAEIVTFSHVRSVDNLADLLTKALPGPTVKNLMSKFGDVSNYLIDTADGE